MQNELRKSGIDVIGDVPWATHFCQFYQSKEDLLNILVPYFKAGLENNEACMWVTSAPLTSDEAERALAKAVPDLAAYLNRHQMEILPHSQWYLKDGYFDLQRVLNGWLARLNDARMRGYSGLRLSGNTAWLEKKDWQNFTEYEAAINKVIGKYNILALCTYCLDTCSATDVIDVIRNHEFALIKQQGKWEQIESAIYKQNKETLKQSEGELSAILASIPLLIFIVGADRRIIKTNNAAAKFAGRYIEEIPGLLSGEALHCLHSLDDPRGCGFSPACQDCLARLNVLDTIETGNNHYQVEWQLSLLRDREKEEVSFLLSTVLLPTPQKQVLVCLEDVTERKKTEQMKDEFIGLVSHELRTPLTVILGSLHTVLTENENLSKDEVTQLLQDSVIETESLSYMIDNLLELSRFEAKRTYLYIEPVDISKLIRRALDRTQRNDISHQFSLRIPRDLPMVNADSQRVERILYNLLDNAVKYSPSGSRVEITMRFENEAFQIAISNEGIGISAEDQRKLFAPFQRLEHSKLSTIGGLGLGVMVCRKLVEAHGGKIWVESEPDHGATFFFTLPLRQQS